MYKEGNDFMNNTDKYKRDFARVLTLLMLLAALFVTDIPVSADTTDSATVSSISAVTEKAEIKLPAIQHLRSAGRNARLHRDM